MLTRKDNGPGNFAFEGGFLGPSVPNREVGCRCFGGASGKRHQNTAQTAKASVNQQLMTMRRGAT